ncbi:MAG: glycosyltransferase family 4 protein [Alphaproteobacteria bacterium]|nr:glycosyltransferase family 4 protein [Alphaproteobacteria bacterium]MBV9201935.1 glycosyltransferase family 4 protein [Alphaproteobacteria bacterium]MBV9373856.1 glycosyltransferase family 4 protein [Alphaproteobacteria bacterium]MBV9815345.1 glycosyltransferase family 4 protein [Alphaproteobacteria bacterium]
MRIAFYAPLKPPDHPVPSGDRRVAQLFLSALRVAGHDVFIASRFRSYDRQGDQHRQARVAAIGERLASRLARRWRVAPETAPELWFTYHLYHKAPDWLGPRVADALGIPYLLAEASDAPKQAASGWSSGRLAAEKAIRRADAVIGLNPADRECVLPLLRDASRWVAFKPFLDAEPFAHRACVRGEPPRLITVAMMRHGDKLASYRILGDALSRLLDQPWSLEVIGDGPARRAVEEALYPLNKRLNWAGVLGDMEIAKRLASADLYVWPALNEAFGMALLEAQASGVPVVAGGGGGVGEVVEPGVTGLLVPPGDAPAFAEAVRSLIADPRRRAAFGEAARQRVRDEHGVTSAARHLNAVIDTVRGAASRD